MKKKLLSMMTLVLAVVALTGCDKDSEGLSRITYYAVLELNGSANMTTQLGSDFNDPGCKATMAGEDVSDQVVTSGNVNTNQLGFYKLNYQVVNEDGFAASASRTVAVVDKNNFASAYFAESQYGTRHYYNAPVTITKAGADTYIIDDLAGGFYSYGRYPGYDAYGYDFFCEAVIKLNADNSITLEETGDWYWGDGPTITSGTYDPATGTVTLIEDFSGTPMYVTLTK